MWVKGAEMWLAPYYEVCFAMNACVLCQVSRNQCTLKGQNTG
jgi:hypothetical protein